MGIFYETYPCGCETVWTSLSFPEDDERIEKSCGLHKSAAELHVRVKAEEPTDAEKQTKADRDLCDRLGLTTERLQEIRGGGYY